MSKVPNYHYSGENSPEALEYLAKDGWYPGEEHMESRVVCIEAKSGIFRKDINFIDARHHPTCPDKLILYFSHPDLPIVPEGDEIPIVGEIIEK